MLPIGLGANAGSGEFRLLSDSRPEDRQGLETTVLDTESPLQSGENNRPPRGGVTAATHVEVRTSARRGAADWLWNTVSAVWYCRTASASLGAWFSLGGVTQGLDRPATMNGVCSQLGSHSSTEFGYLGNLDATALPDGMNGTWLRGCVGPTTSTVWQRGGRCMIPSRSGGQARRVPMLPSSCRDKVWSADWYGSM